MWRIPTFATEQGGIRAYRYLPALRHHSETAYNIAGHRRGVLEKTASKGIRTISLRHFGWQHHRQQRGGTEKSISGHQQAGGQVVEQCR